MVRLLLLMSVSLACLADEPTEVPSAAIHVDVSEVTVSVSVTDRDGAPVSDLGRADFLLLDNKDPQPIQSFRRDTDLPLIIGLIADVSGSQLGVIGKHRETLRQFLTQVMDPEDRAFLVTIGNTDIKVVTDLTNSADALIEGLDGVEHKQNLGEPIGEPCGPRGHSFGLFGNCGTPLWDGIVAVAQLKMKPLVGRKALIVVSDGEDQGSTHTVTDAIEAAQSADTLVYTLHYLSSPRAKAPLNDAMQKLSDETGGRAYPDPGDPADVFAEIEQALRNLYVLGFVPPEDARDGKFHQLKITVPGRDVRVRARQGYTIPASPN